jgi:hypothetical protein
MNATELMALAMLLAVLGRWEHGEAAIPSGKGIVEIIFALLLVAFLDQGRTAPIAQGFAYVFLAAVLLGSKSPLTGLAGATVVPAKNSSGATATPAAAGTATNSGGSGKVLKTF